MLRPRNLRMRRERGSNAIDERDAEWLPLAPIHLPDVKRQIEISMATVARWEAGRCPGSSDIPRPVNV
jgi:hypothetical protein